MKFLTKLFLLLFIIFSSFAFAQNTKPIIVFDYGEVICTSDKDTINQFLQTSFHLSDAEFKQTMKAFHDALVNGMPEMEFWGRVAKKQNVVIDREMVKNYKKIQLAGVKEIPGMVSLVKSLQKNGYQTALFSNVVKKYADIVKQLGYYDLFDPVLLSYEIGVVKPKTRAYEILMETLDATPKQCIFVDDNIEHVEAAKSFGIDSILFTSYEDLIEEFEKREIIL